jgi:hypothetical protein
VSLENCDSWWCPNTEGRGDDCGGMGPLLYFAIFLYWCDVYGVLFFQNFWFIVSCLFWMIFLAKLIWFLTRNLLNKLHHLCGIFYSLNLVLTWNVCRMRIYQYLTAL